MKTSIFKGTVDTPFGLFLVAVDSTAQDAKRDIYSAVYSLFNMPQGMARVTNEISKSNRRILGKMAPIKNATSYHSGQWGWAKKVK